MDVILVFILFFTVAYFYASVGHGGASGYLALMALLSISSLTIKPTALTLNIMVSLMAFIQFYRAGYFKSKLFLYCVLTSVAFAFLGGYIQIDERLYQFFLAIFLVFSALRLYWMKEKKIQKKDFDKLGALGIGGSIGFISGLLGIGGGVILSPILLILKWVNQKEAAAISALFIFVNSVSGFIGNMISGVNLQAVFLQSHYFIMVLGVLMGGLIGSYFGAFRFTPAIIKYLLSFVLLMASIKLFVVLLV